LVLSSRSPHQPHQAGDKAISQISILSRFSGQSDQDGGRQCPSQPRARFGRSIMGLAASGARVCRSRVGRNRPVLHSGHGGEPGLLAWSPRRGDTSESRSLCRSRRHERHACDTWCSGSFCSLSDCPPRKHGLLTSCGFWIEAPSAENVMAPTIDELERPVSATRAAKAAILSLSVPHLPVFSDAGPHDEPNTKQLPREV